MNLTYIKCKNLSQQKGKCLRYIVSRGELAPTRPDSVVSHIWWSDLPHSYLEAILCFKSLISLGLAKSSNYKGAITPTPLGIKVVKLANKKGMWKTPPPPSVVNSRRRN